MRYEENKGATRKILAQKLAQLYWWYRLDPVHYLQSKGKGATTGPKIKTYVLMIGLTRSITCNPRHRPIMWGIKYENPRNTRIFLFSKFIISKFWIWESQIILYLFTFLILEMVLSLLNFKDWILRGKIDVSRVLNYLVILLEMIRWVEIQWNRKEDRFPWELNWKGWHTVYITRAIIIICILCYQWLSIGVSFLFDMETQWIFLRNWLMLSLSFGSWLKYLSFFCVLTCEHLLHLVMALWKSVKYSFH